MPTLKKYPEPRLWIRRGSARTILYYDVAGRKKQKALTNDLREMGVLGTDQEEAASNRFLAEFKVALAARRLSDTGGEEGGPMTVAGWAKKHFIDRERKGVVTASNLEARYKQHISPHIGHVRLSQLGREHIELVMDACVETLAPRSRLNVYSLMRAMFRRAARAGYMVKFPEMDPKDLPAPDDKDLEWRETAGYSREEIQQLLTDERIPINRRVFYAVLFLAGLRCSEAAALRFKHYNPKMASLGQLVVVRSYNTEKKAIKGTKTKKGRKVPIHPWLADILAQWAAHGWATLQGRVPTMEDIMFPATRGKHRNRHTSYNDLQKDLVMIGLRRRRQHETRFAFISHALEDGAPADWLEMVTHGAKKSSAFAGYRVTPWRSLCEAVAKLKLGPPALKSLESLGGGLPDGCHVQEQQGKQVVAMDNTNSPWTVTSKRQSESNDATYGHSAKNGGIERREAASSGAPGGQIGLRGNLATLALRQALAALDRGRIDQAREIIAQAIADERQPGRARG